MDYYKQLQEIPFYKLHPSYLPFVGEDYNKYRILQISESHYCMEITDRDKYGIAYFENWFVSEGTDVETIILQGNITRRVCDGVMGNGDGTQRSFPNFDNPLRSFCDIVLHLGKLRMSKYNENRKKYSHFAFMNFYQIPAFQNMGCFKDSFYKEAKKEKIKNPEDVLNQWRKESTELIDQVIDILKPKAVAFTSMDAWKAYEENNGKYRNSEIIIRAAHPNRPWNNHHADLDGKTGKQAFEGGLRKIYNQ